MLRKGAPYLAGFLLGLLSTGVMMHFAAGPPGQPIVLHPPPSPPPIRVYVAGAVVTPGVYSLPTGSIVENAIERAGGALPTAALATLNLAAPLEDGDRVYVSEELEQAVGEPPESPIDTSTGGTIPINLATEPELERLPGIGPSLAAAIVQYRRDHGPFNSIDDLMEVPGIGPAKLEAIRDMVRID